MCFGLNIFFGGFFFTGTSWPDSDARRLEKAKLSISEAIIAAKKHQGGKAFEEKIDSENSTPEFEVKILKESKIFEVTVDGLSGKIIKTKSE